MAKARRRLNKKIIGLLADATSIGATRDLAARYAGIGMSTFMDWMQKGRSEIEKIENGEERDPSMRLYVELVEQVDNAQSVAGIEWLQVVQAAATKDPNWARYMLERHFEGFRPAPPAVAQVNVNVGVTSDELAEARSKALALEVEMLGSDEQEEGEDEGTSDKS